MLFRSHLGELMAAKAEAEHGSLGGLSRELIERDVVGLQGLLDEAEVASKLPDVPSADAALNDLLIRTRLSF